MGTDSRYRATLYGIGDGVITTDGEGRVEIMNPVGPGQTHGRPGLRCLYISGYPAEVIADHGVIEEGVHFLPKPFTLDALAERLREVLDSPE